MKTKDVQKRERKSVQVSIRTTETYSKFMAKHSISPNAVFEKAMEELVKEE